MTVLEAMCDFWSSFGVPAYKDDEVPNDAKYPYITYSVTDGSLYSAVPSVANYWTRGGIRDCSEFYTAVRETIHEGGKCIKTDAGLVILYRGADFLIVAPERTADLHPTGVTGVRVSYEMQFYCV